jgi:hypothetical protein
MAHSYVQRGDLQGLDAHIRSNPNDINAKDWVRMWFY